MTRIEDFCTWMMDTVWDLVDEYHCEFELNVNTQPNFMKAYQLNKTIPESQLKELKDAWAFTLDSKDTSKSPIICVSSERLNSLLSTDTQMNLIKTYYTVLFRHEIGHILTGHRALGKTEWNLLQKYDKIERCKLYSNMAYGKASPFEKYMMYMRLPLEQMANTATSIVTDDWVKVKSILQA